MSGGRVTSAAQLLLGFISGSVHRRDGVYAITEVVPAQGSAIIQPIGSDARFRLTVVQLEEPGEVR